MVANLIVPFASGIVVAMVATYGTDAVAALGIATRIESLAHLQTQIEIFLIPGQLAVVQYHVRPDSESAITVPIGYITVEKERMTRIETYLDNVTKDRGKPLLAWTNAELTIDAILGDCRTKFCKANRKPLLSMDKASLIRRELTKKDL